MDRSSRMFFRPLDLLVLYPCHFGDHWFKGVSCLKSSWRSAKHMILRMFFQKHPQCVMGHP